MVLRNAGLADTICLNSGKAWKKSNLDMWKHIYVGFWNPRGGMNQPRRIPLIRILDVELGNLKFLEHRVVNPRINYGPILFRLPLEPYTFVHRRKKQGSHIKVWRFQQIQIHLSLWSRTRLCLRDRPALISQFITLQLSLSSNASCLISSSLSEISWVQLVQCLKLHQWRLE